MQTKLSRYADGIMEAAWLAAMIVVPVFFNVFSSRIFEPDKITLLRTLALVALVAWLVKLFEQGGARWQALKLEGSPVKTLLRTPLIGLVGALALVYLISTIFSITPRVSLLGSYQRLQGTYTTFAYLAFFAVIAANLRQRSQVERLITTAIIASLAVSLYGVLQRYGLDPVPWGGDVTNRIASNMGNSIFVAAYLVMVFPPTLMRIVDSFNALVSGRGELAPNFVRSTLYVFTGALQVIAIYFSGSRGPWLGLFTSLVLLWLGLSLIWRARWLTISGVALALAAGGFLLLLNLPAGPLQDLRTRPEFGRLGQLLDTESRTGRVRSLIWQGASELVLPHEPLEFPDGRKDAFNFLRPLIGYGPESMYVAYNRFYPPELTQVEKRNASPDRSHNETWDSLVITGVAGLAVYLALFGSVLFFGLKWLGLVASARQRNLFLALYLFGGAVSSTAFIAWQGVSYLGVALPFGMILGVVAYLIIVALFGRFPALDTPHEKLRAYMLLGLLAAVVAHFVEINFGIAIVATRTYFWVYSALILLVGTILPLHKEYAAPEAAAKSSGDALPAETPAAKGSEHAARAPVEPRRRERKAKTAPGRAAARSSSLFAGHGWDSWMREALLSGALMAILLSTMGFNYISNQTRQMEVFSLIWRSFTQNQKGQPAGILWLVIIVWLVGVLLLTSEAWRERPAGHKSDLANWLRMMLLAAGVSAFLALVYWLWLAQGLVTLVRTTAQSMEDVIRQVQLSEGLLTNFYVYLFLLIFLLAMLIPLTWPALRWRSQALSVALAAGALAVAFTIAAYSNLRIIQADIAFKTGDFFARPNTWPVSIAIYQRANRLAPAEDYYYLFLGRAYLEYAKTLQDANERNRLIEQAARDLQKAQEINPLNTDHTANLARLHSLWASFVNDPAQRAALAAQAETYFQDALSLSPNNARLWDEWAAHYMNIMQRPADALRLLQRALELDPFYDWTYGLLADYYQRFESQKEGAAPQEQQQALLQATEYYSQAIKYADPSNPSLKYSYLASLGNLYAQLSMFDRAIQVYEQAIPVLPNQDERWRLEIALARMYFQLGDPSNAMNYAQQALQTAPEDQKPAVEEFIRQLQGQP